MKPRLLARIAQLFSKQDDEVQAYHYQLESYRVWPVDINVITWLGIYYVPGILEIDPLIKKTKWCYTHRLSRIQSRSFVVGCGELALPVGSDHFGNAGGKTQFRQKLLDPISIPPNSRWVSRCLRGKSSALRFSGIEPILPSRLYLPSASR